MKLRARRSFGSTGLALTLAIATGSTLAGVALADGPKIVPRTAPVAPAPPVPVVVAAPTLKPIVLDGIGKVTDFKVTGFGSPTAKGRLDVSGTGSCRFRAQIADLSKSSQETPPFGKVFSDAVTLPLVMDNIPPLPNGKYRAYLISYNDKNCPIQGPNKAAGGWYLDFNVTGTSAPASAPTQTGGTPNGGGGGGGAPPPAGGAPPAPKAATGKISALSVPGGSFAEDDTQKFLVNGLGGCALDLAISIQSYGGSYNQTFPVNPVKLDSGATLYNGTHFGTLAEGSYHATATGKTGCTGTAAIDFKVTPKSSTKKILGKPTLGFDKQPISGGVFTKSKDSNIWFKVTLPQSIKGEPSASCCDIEFDYQNEFGGWEPLPNSPFSDSGFSLAATQQAAVVNKSVSGFTQGTHWRVKVRAYKFKTEFEWSDWVEFTTNQN
jgi:hypothetical protein